MCMYMPTVVSSGSSIRILYPRESYDSWEDPECPIRIVCQSTTWYLVRILYPREYYDSWVDHEGLVRMVCLSTTKYCCCTYLILLSYDDDVVVSDLWC
jgi:hypothetical protein